MSITKTRLSIKNILSRVSGVLGTNKSKDMAIEFGVSPQTVTNWKKRNAIPWSELFELATSREIDFGWLLTGVETKTAAPASGECKDCARKDRFIDQQSVLIERMMTRDKEERRPSAGNTPYCSEKIGKRAAVGRSGGSVCPLSNQYFLATPADGFGVIVAATWLLVDVFHGDKYVPLIGVEPILLGNISLRNILVRADKSIRIVSAVIDSGVPQKIFDVFVWERRARMFSGRVIRYGAKKAAIIGRMLNEVSISQAAIRSGEGSRRHRA